ncbi:iron-containing redox enzyme family protein [Streptomyces sp. NBC_00876]|uniref:TenA family transcriptional regulator n=1 Tax=Streptomyces sp. NBC_00876 TaxID=2975853 RepID=UPI003862D65A|nr:iron-containing redox enzyme family protein [Streptomyces sp. NBC_00876]
MQSLDEFFTGLNAEVKATDCVDNDFFAAFRAQKLTVDDVQRFADQYYLYIRTFPQILAGLAHRVDNEEIRRELAKTIVSELGGGGEGGMGHYKMFKNSCEPLGIEVAKAGSIDYLPETTALVEGIRTLFLEGSVEAALGGHYTIELSGLPMINSFYEGFRALPGSTVESMEYFYLHLLIEREHVEWIHAAVEQATGGPESRAEIERGALLIAGLLGDFWGALHRELVLKPVGV